MVQPKNCKAVAIGSKVLVKAREGNITGQCVFLKHEPEFRIEILPTTGVNTKQNVNLPTSIVFYQKDIIEVIPQEVPQISTSDDENYNKTHDDDDHDDGALWNVITENKNSTNRLDVSRTSHGSVGATSSIRELVSKNEPHKPKLQSLQDLIKLNKPKSAASDLNDTSEEETSTDEKYPHVYISNLDSAISILESFYEECKQIGVRIYSNHSTGLFISSAAEISVIAIKMDKLIYYLDRTVIFNDSSEQSRRSFVRCLKKYLESKRILKFVHGFSHASRFVYRSLGIRIANAIDLDEMYKNVTSDESSHQCIKSSTSSLPALIRDYIEDEKHRLSIEKYLKWVDELDWSGQLDRQHELVMMIETAYLIDLFEIFSKKSMQRWLKDSEKVLCVDDDDDDDDDDGDSESDDQYNDHFKHSQQQKTSPLRCSNELAVLKPTSKPVGKPLRSSSPETSSSLSSSLHSTSPRQRVVHRSSTTNGINRVSLKDILKTNNKWSRPTAVSANDESSNETTHESFSCALAREHSSLSMRSASNYPHYNFKPAGYQQPNFPSRKK